MQSFKDKFEAYGGDYEGTMARFMGNEAMYRKFLGMLFQDQNLQKLGDALEGGDMQAAFEAAHTLKGVVGNMGLTPLYQAVCAIVEPLRAKEGADYAALYRAVRAQYARAEALKNDLAGGERA
ncbi:hypothetical protein CE91St41_01680 [Oscillospiraceae bacterium]|nr:hypothetical protein CE91St40_01680 [Oscillospiraceae bacterium]BDF73279.1 hypothetical protein CE91St41_01680 [Oscillospiraceae bacterium]